MWIGEPAEIRGRLRVGGGDPQAGFEGPGRIVAAAEGHEHTAEIVGGVGVGWIGGHRRLENCHGSLGVESGHGRAKVEEQVAVVRRLRQERRPELRRFPGACLHEAAGEVLAGGKRIRPAADGRAEQRLACRVALPIEWLAARGWNVHRARLAVFGLCAALIALLAPAMLLPAGGFLLAIQLLAAYGTLGVAPIYYSLNQELSGRAQGKVGGSLSFLLWCVLGWMQGSIGKLVKSTPDARPLVFAGVAVLPLLALVGLVWGWGRTGKSATAADHD